MYVDTIFESYGCFFFNCLVGCLSMIVWTPAVLGAYMYVFCIFVFAPVQCD